MKRFLLLLLAVPLGLYGQLQPVNLPLYENFENVSGSYAGSSNCIYCTPSIEFYLATSHSSQVSFDMGYSNTTIGISDTVSAVLDGGGYNQFTAVLDMSNYDTNDVGSVLLAFYHFSFFDEADPEDRVHIRGAHTEPWIELYDLTTDRIDSQWVGVSNLNLSEALRKNNQNFSPTFQIRFGQYDNGAAPATDGRAIDDILLESVDCAPPFTITHEVMADTAAIIRWQTPKSSVQSQLWIGYNGDFITNPSLGSVLSSTADSLRISTLQPNTCYEYWLQTICSAGDTSQWTGPFHFCTPCSVIQLPYFEDFDQTIHGATGNLGNCWHTKIVDVPTTFVAGWRSYMFEASTGSWGLALNDRPVFHAGKGFGNFALVGWDPSHAYTNYISSLELNSPVNLSGVSNPQLRFSTHVSSSFSSTTLTVEVDSGNGWNSVYTFTGPSQPNLSAPWQDHIADLTGYSGFVKIRFKSIRGSGTYAAIDNIAIDKPITCPLPDSVQVISASENSVQIHIAPYNSNYTYQVSYGLAGQPSGTRSVVNSTQDTITLTGLTNSSQYEFAIRVICGPTDTSYWSDDYLVRTSCPPLTAPYFTGFDVPGPDLPPCWLAVGSIENFTIAQVDSTDRGMPPPSLPQALEINDGTFVSFAVGPSFSDLPSGLNRVRFKAAYELGYDAQDIRDSLFLGTMPNMYDTAGFVRYAHVSLVNPTDSFREYIIELDDTPLIGNNTVLAFRLESDGGHLEYYIDDFYYEPIYGCVQPTGLSYVDTACGTLALSWGSGSGKSFIEYGLKGFQPGTGTFTGIVSSPHLISGLNTLEYDFYLADTCRGDTSSFIGPLTVKPQVHLPEGHIVVVSDVVNGSLHDLTLNGDVSKDADIYAWVINNDVNNTLYGSQVTVQYTTLPVNIRLITKNGCGNDTLDFLYNPIGLEERSAPQVYVFPNPSSGNFKIGFGADSDTFSRIIIHNSNGKIVYFQELNGEKEMDISLHGAPGVYFLQLEGEKQVPLYTTIVKW